MFKNANELFYNLQDLPSFNMQLNRCLGLAVAARWE